jgi:hypothetical protein
VTGSRFGAARAAYAARMAQPPEDPAASAERMRTLLARWQQSLELHLRYLQLDDAHYWHVQPWPSHERPVAWIVQLARQKTAELARMLAERTARGDLQFAIGLEQMVFLANLVGLQPAGRHLPLADPQNEQHQIMPPADTSTREMPRPRPARASAPRASRTSRGSAEARAPPPAPAAAPMDRATRQVFDDAVRLLQWGRKWHELGELISRLAERPSVGDTRRILRAHRPQIEAAAAKSARTPQ